MSTLNPEQWRVLGRLKYLCGERAHLDIMMKGQDVPPEALVELIERGLVIAKLNGEVIDLTPGLIKSYRKRIILRLSPTGESFYWNDPHRVLRSIGRTIHGSSLSYLLGIVHFEDLTDLARRGLIRAQTEDDTVDLSDARQPWPGSSKVILPGGAELWLHDVRVWTTKAGQLYCERN